MKESVAVEREFGAAVDPEDLRARIVDGEWCLRLHDARYLRGYLSLDRERMVCLFEAPDAEAVRRMNDRVELPYVRAWGATLHGAPPTAHPHGVIVLVERSFVEPVAFEAIQAREDAGAWCLDRHDVRFLETFFSRDRKRMICAYDAPDAESVRACQRTIAMPVERVWPCTLFSNPFPDPSV